jgi:hypothetical protein
VATILFKAELNIRLTRLFYNYLASRQRDISRRIKQ